MSATKRGRGQRRNRRQKNRMQAHCEVWAFRLLRGQGRRATRDHVAQLIGILRTWPEVPL